MRKHIAAQPLQEVIALEFKKAIDQVPEENGMLSELWSRINYLIEKQPQTNENEKSNWIMIPNRQHSRIICGANMYLKNDEEGCEIEPEEQ